MRALLADVIACHLAIPVQRPEKERSIASRLPLAIRKVAALRGAAGAGFGPPALSAPQP
jgi:hypothetical protein